MRRRARRAPTADAPPPPSETAATTAAAADATTTTTAAAASSAPAVVAPPRPADDLIDHAPGLSPAILCVDARRADDLYALCSSTAVLLSCLPESSLLGQLVVDACLDCGTDLVDVSCELEHVRRVVRDADSPARQRDVVVLPSCGFDGVVLETACALALARAAAAMHLHARDGALPPRVALASYVDYGLSPYTSSHWRSLLASYAQLLRRRGAGAGTAELLRLVRALPRYDRVVGAWVLPLPLLFASAAPLVVAHSQRCGGGGGGVGGVAGVGVGGGGDDDDDDDDDVTTRRDPTRPLRQYVCATSWLDGVWRWLVYVLASFVALSALGRALLLRCVGGAQPSDEDRAFDRTRMRVVAQLPTRNHSAPLVVESSIELANVYDCSAACAAACAFVLATQRSDVPRSGGVLTPSAAFGAWLPAMLAEWCGGVFATDVRRDGAIAAGVAAELRGGAVGGGEGGAGGGDVD